MGIILLRLAVSLNLKTSTYFSNKTLHLTAVIVTTLTKPKSASNGLSHLKPIEPILKLTASNLHDSLTYENRNVDTNVHFVENRRLHFDRYHLRFQL